MDVIDAAHSGPHKSRPRGGRIDPAPGPIIGKIVLTIVLVILSTELVEEWHPQSEFIEGVLHVLVLVVTLVPIFFGFWYRPLSVQILERQRSESAVRDLNRQLLVAGEEERRKLARDLHDDLGQKLTFLQMRLEALGAQASASQPELAADYKQLTDLARDLSFNLRQVISDLRPELLDDLGLPEALKALLFEFQKGTTLEIDFTSRGLKDRLPAKVELALFRVCQEGLTNIIKHAKASHAVVRLVVSYPQVILSVEDDGVGLPRGSKSKGAPPRGGFGMISMGERVASVGGTIQFHSRPGSGTRIRVEVPLIGEPAI